MKGREGLTDKSANFGLSRFYPPRRMARVKDKASVGPVPYSDKHVPTSARFEPTRAHSLDAYTHTNSLPPPPETASMLTALNFTSAVAPTKLSVKLSQSASKKAGFHVVAVSHP